MLFRLVISVKFRSAATLAILISPRLKGIEDSLENILAAFRAEISFCI